MIFTLLPVKGLPAVMLRRSSSGESRRAVVLKVRAVDACRLARFEAMSRLAKAMPMDVWILSDDVMQPEAASGFAAIASKNPRAFFARTPSVDTTRYPAFKGSEGKEQKWPFALWLNQSKYEFAWYVEDDMVFTGEWHTFFGPAEDKAESADLVMDWLQQDKTWYHAQGCRLRGKPCLEGNSMLQSRLALFRMSRRLASEWLNLRAQRQLEGYDEATLGTVCDKWPACRRSRVHNPGGVYRLGHFGVFKAKNTNPVYTLRVVASYSNETRMVNFSRFPTDADVPRNQLFHPVKCEAEAANVGNVHGESRGIEPQARKREGSPWHRPSKKIGFAGRP